MWKTGGEMARPEDCPVDAWVKLIKYWKSPMAECESERMQQIRAMVSNPWKHGQIGVSHSMSLEGAIGLGFDKDGDPLNELTTEAATSKKRVGNLNKKKSVFKQQCFKLDEKWKASMEAKVDPLVAGMTKVDSMVESMVEIKVMLHKRHGHSKVDMYIDPSTTTNEGTFTAMARIGKNFKEMAITLVPYVATLVPTLPSLKEQEIDRDDPFYVPILDHLMGATQVLECSQTQLLDVENKTSDSDSTMGGRKRRKVDKGKDSKGKKVQSMVVAKVDEDDGQMF
ncbi:unnamed protein product [Sphagnum compactum]